jgi:hypothetical protein
LQDTVISAALTVSTVGFLPSRLVWRSLTDSNFLQIKDDFDVSKFYAGQDILGIIASAFGMASSVAAFGSNPVV